MQNVRFKVRSFAVFVTTLLLYLAKNIFLSCPLTPYTVLYMTRGARTVLNSTFREQTSYDLVYRIDLVGAIMYSNWPRGQRGTCTPVVEHHLYY